MYAESAPGAFNSFSSSKDGFDENNIAYDAGGSLVTLSRNSSNEGANIGNLMYNYNSASPNQLYTVTDATHNTAGFNPGTGSGNYVYDNNGNLTTDPYKGLGIGYDVLNRTDKITVTGGTNQYINYTYDASGSLIRKQAYNNNVLGTQTDYIDGFVYLTVSGTTTLSYFPMPEGRVLNNGSGTLKQEFIITDQQGNARVSFQDNGSGIAMVKQENSYYGFGLQMTSPVGLPTPPNKQLYNGGSEWQNDYSNLPDYYQTFNRNYDAALGRFVGVDPEAESAESMSTYQYAGNNPIMYNDPLGNKIKIVDQSGGQDASEFAGEQAELELENEAYDFVYGGGASFGVAASDGGGGGAGNASYGSTGGGGLNDQQIDFINNWSPDKGSFNLSSQGIYPLSPQAVLTVGAAYLDSFSAWGTNGFANNYASAVFSYDVNRPQGTTALSVGDRSDTWISGNLGDGTFTVHSTYTANQGGIDWKNVRSAGLGVIGGVAEAFVGFATSETGVGAFAFFDGFGRVITNGTRLFGALAHNKQLANGPSNWGSYLGLVLDSAPLTRNLTNGKAATILGVTNDLGTFLVTGGNGANLQLLLEETGPLQLSGGASYITGWYTLGDYIDTYGKKN